MIRYAGDCKCPTSPVESFPSVALDMPFLSSN